MGRQKRTWDPSLFYHVVCRGNRRDALFKNENDFRAFLYILHSLFEKYPFEIASYCLMTNHFHLQIRSKETPLSKIMSLVNKRYANYYNHRNHLTGHVFEKRFFSEAIENSQGMLEVSKYIHLNPVAARMTERPEDYNWSSSRFYLFFEENAPSYMNLSSIFDLFSGCAVVKRERYREFIKHHIKT